MRALCSDVAGHGYVALTGERAGREEREGGREGGGGKDGGRERGVGREGEREKEGGRKQEIFLRRKHVTKKKD